MSNALSYCEIRPGKALQAYIYCYWTFSYDAVDGAEMLEHSIPPDGCSSLAFPYHPQLPRGQVSLLGPQTSIFRLPVYPGTKCLGIRFMPGVVKALLGTSPKEWVDQNLDGTSFLDETRRLEIAAQWPARAVTADWLDPIFESWLAEQTFELDEPILQAVQLILEGGGNVKTSHLAQQVFLSERQFQRRFQEAVGLSPKIFCRIRRMRAALVERLLAEKSYADILFDHGYTDKSHFNRDFSSLAGLPSAELEKYLRQIEHLGMED